jgi:MYXO-CTERM domain-containing protein
MSKKLIMLGLMLLLVLGANVGVYAQTGTGTGTGAGDTGAATYGDTARDDDGPDLGWLGLLGLAGLMGLKRREAHRDVRTTAPAAR